MNGDQSLLDHIIDPIELLQSLANKLRQVRGHLGQERFVGLAVSVLGSPHPVGKSPVEVGIQACSPPGVRTSPVRGYLPNPLFSNVTAAALAPHPEVRRTKDVHVSEAHAGSGVGAAPTPPADRIWFC